MNAERITLLLDEHAPHVGASGNGKWNAECLSVNCGWADHGSAGGMFAGAQAHRAHVAEVIAREAGEREARLRAGVERVAARMAGEDDGLFVDRMTRLSQAAAELRAVLDQGDEGDT